MKFYSPLRYPGGKNKLAKFIALICMENNINGTYIEPYAGGASVALHLLINGHVKEIIIKLGGNIGVKSAFGSGSTFIINIPDESNGKSHG